MKQLNKIHHSSEIKSFILYEMLKIRYIFGIQKLMTYCTLISNSNWFLVLILKVTLLKKPFILIFCRENLLKKTAAIISPADAIFSITIEDGGLGIWQFPQPFLNICVWIYQRYFRILYEMF